MLDQRPHMTEDKRQQQGPDVAAVDISIRHQDDFPIASLRHIFEFSHRWTTNSLKQIRDFRVIENLDELSLLDVQDLSA